MKRLRTWVACNLFEYQGGPNIYSLVFFGSLYVSWWRRDYSDDWRKRWLGFHWGRD